MKVIIQQAESAKVLIDNKLYSSIDKGMLIFLGIHKDDTVQDINTLVKKILKIRIFKDVKNKSNFSISDLNLSILLVSQFTLYANMKKGNRPSYIDAAKSKQAQSLYNLFIKELKQYNINLQTGQFGANMDIHLINKGPNTYILES